MSRVDRLICHVLPRAFLMALVAEGRLVRSDHPDPGCFVTGVVDLDRREGWWVVAQTMWSVSQHLPPVLLEGLDPDATYRVTEETPEVAQHGLDLAPRRVDVVLTGRALGAVGVRLGVIAPETARVLRATLVVE